LKRAGIGFRPFPCPPVVDRRDRNFRRPSFLDTSTFDPPFSGGFPADSRRKCSISRIAHPRPFRVSPCPAATLYFLLAAAPSIVARRVLRPTPAGVLLGNKPRTRPSGFWLADCRRREPGGPLGGVFRPFGFFMGKPVCPSGVVSCFPGKVPGFQKKKKCAHEPRGWSSGG